MNAAIAFLPDSQPLIGREYEEQRLRAYLQHAADGHGSLVLIAGEAGIGKTSLVRGMLREAGTLGAAAFHGGCYDLTTTPPYGPWSDALRGYQPTPGDPAIPDWLARSVAPERPGSQPAMLAELQSFLEALAAQRPTVVVLEDLHWADRASLEALRYLGRQLERAPILFVATYRSDELGLGDDLAQLLPILVRESRARRIHLNRLDRAGIALLVERRYALDAAEHERLAAHVWDRSEGNPFFAHEILQSLEDGRWLEPLDDGWRLADLEGAPVPLLLRQVLDDRLARLAPESRRALEVAAVIGLEVPLDLWQAAAELDAEQFDRVLVEAMNLRLLDETPRAMTLRFRHALFREALYAALPPGRWRALHRLSAEALIAKTHPDPDAIADHFRQAGDPRELEWLVRAGLRARAAAAFRAAIERFERAAELLAGDTARIRERAWLAFYAVFLSRYHGELSPDERLDEAERLAVLSGDHLLMTSILFHRGLRYSLRGQARRGLEQFRAAVEAFDDLARSEPVIHVDIRAPAVIRTLLGEDPPADPAHPMYQIDAGEPPRRAPVFARCILATWLGFGGHYREAIEVGEAIVEEMTEAYGEAHLRTVPGASGHFALGQAYAAMGRTDEARRELALARQGYTLVGDSSMADVAVWSELLYTVLPFQADRPVERARLAAESERIRGMNVSLSPYADLATPGIVAVNVIDGRWEVARAQATGLLTSYALPMVQSGAALLGALARWQGEPEVALCQIEALLPDGPDTEPGDSYFPAANAAQRLAADLALDSGDLDLAGRWVAAHARWLEWSGAELWRVEQHLLEARYALVAGDLEATRVAAELALALAGNPRQPLATLAARRLLGVAAARVGNLSLAREHLHVALALAAECEAPFERALTLVDLAELGVGVGGARTVRQFLAEAREIAASRGARWLLERIDRLAGGPVAARRYPDGLTGREVEILRLLAAGQSNQQIASQLVISTRTVERHIANVYRKIGAHNRAEAAAYAVSNQLASDTA